MVTDQTTWRILGRAFCLFAAFVVGFAVYMVEAIRTSYDGFPSIFILPFMATIVSGAVVLIAFLVGLVLLLRPLKCFWTSSRVWAGLVSLIGLLLLLFGYTVGLRDTGYNPELGTEFEMLHPAAALGGYFLLLFGIANMPVFLRPQVGAETNQPKSEAIAQ
ncbi:MAG: hypothetical protein IT585_01190 [candidate division Zixibacteria bacterium]|nr:hypothetical protein [candidate division Zixibacteria bacterium]